MIFADLPQCKVCNEYFIIKIVDGMCGGLVVSRIGFWLRGPRFNSSTLQTFFSRESDHKIYLVSGHLEQERRIKVNSILCCSYGLK